MKLNLKPAIQPLWCTSCHQVKDAQDFPETERTKDEKERKCATCLNTGTISITNTNNSVSFGGSFNVASPFKFNSSSTGTIQFQSSAFQAFTPFRAFQPAEPEDPDKKQRKLWLQQTKPVASKEVTQELSDWTNQSISFIQQCVPIVETCGADTMINVLKCVSSVLSKALQSRGVINEYSLNQSVLALREQRFLEEKHVYSFTSTLEPAEKALAADPNTEFTVDQKKEILEVVWTYVNHVKDEVLPQFGENLPAS